MPTGRMNVWQIRWADGVGNRGRLLLTVVAALALAVPIMAGVPGEAAPAAATRGPESRWATQERLDRLADRVEAAATSDPAFSAVEVDVPRGLVIVRRVGGDRSPAAARYRTAFAAAAGPGDAAVALRVASARLNADQDRHLEQRLHAEVGGLWRAGIRVRSYGRSAGGGPFRIGVVGAARHRAVLLRRFGGYGPKSVEIHEHVRREPGLNRLADTAPYYGGGRIKAAANYNNCTAGFGALSTNGSHYLLTAAHCLYIADPRWWTGSNLFIGRSTATDTDLDTTYIKTSTAPYIFDGGISSNLITKRVVGQAGFRRGDEVCVSGSFSGTRCEGIIDHSQIANQCFSNGSCRQILVTIASHRRGSYLARNGDSGAPVFTPRSDLTTVIARGIFSQLYNAYPCPNDSTRRCATTIGFVDITTITARRNLNVTR